MRGRGWARHWGRSVLIGIAPVVLAAGCGTSGFAPEETGSTAPGSNAPLVAELSPACGSRHLVVFVDRPATGAATQEGALTAFLATPAERSLMGVLFEPALPPPDGQPIPPLPVGSTSSAVPAVTSATAATTPSTRQWFARHDHEGRVTTVIRVDEAADGWAVTAMYGCVSHTPAGPTQTTLATSSSGP